MKRILHLVVQILFLDFRVFTGIFVLYLYDEWYVRLTHMDDVSRPYESYVDRLRSVYDRANRAIARNAKLDACREEILKQMH
jgi:hypothetical protein